MHHPDISNIVKTLDDYFLIQFPDSLATIKGTKLDWGNDDSLVIARNLKNGRLEIHIKGDDKDDDSVRIVYYQSGSTQSWDERTDLSSSEFNIELVRNGIRKLVIHDANPPALILSQDEDDD